MFRILSPVLSGLILGFLGFCCGCDDAKKSLDREVSIAIRASLGELSSHEKDMLLLENHPILYRASDPSVRLILQLFAEMSEEQRRT